MPTQDPTPQQREAWSRAIDQNRYGITAAVVMSVGIWPLDQMGVLLWLSRTGTATVPFPFEYMRNPPAGSLYELIPADLRADLLSTPQEDNHVAILASDTRTSEFLIASVHLEPVDVEAFAIVDLAKFQASGKPSPTSN